MKNMKQEFEKTLQIEAGKIRSMVMQGLLLQCIYNVSRRCRFHDRTTSGQERAQTSKQIYTVNMCGHKVSS